MLSERKEIISHDSAAMYCVMCILFQFQITFFIDQYYIIPHQNNTVMNSYIVVMLNLFVVNDANPYPINLSCHHLYKDILEFTTI
jgi:hypothetical protein